jgi:2'-5' RNA ligase
MNWYKKAKKDTEHEYSCAMLPLTGDIAAAMLAFARDIPDSDLADDGREDEPHVTILYGLHTNDVNEVKDALSGEKEVKITLGKIKFFAADEKRNSDVLILDVDSEDLLRLNKKLRKLDCTNTREYKPHATIAYVKAGKGAEYEGKSVCSKTVTNNVIEFSAKNGKRTCFSLGTKKISYKTAQGYDDIQRRDYETDEEFEAHQYFSIGQNEDNDEDNEEGSFCWCISPMGQFRFKKGGTHAMNFGVQSREFWRGWYDPRQRLLSVVCPRDKRDAGKKSWTDIPSPIKKILNEESARLGWTWLPKVF